jgi:DNA polymerase-4
MARLGIATGADLAAKDRAWLAQHFGSFGEYLYRAARGIDERPVRVNRIRKSIGGERTFSADRHEAEELRTTLDEIVEIVWERIERAQARGRTVTLKLKYNDFQLMTRARSLPRNVDGKAEFAALGHEILESLLPLPKPIRLMGLTLSNLERDGDEEALRRDSKTGQLSLL